jgi:hypothetical protein
MALQTNPGRRPRPPRGPTLTGDDDYLDPLPPGPGDATEGELKTIVGRAPAERAADPVTDSGAHKADDDGMDEAADALPHPLQRAVREVEATIDGELVTLLEKLDGLRGSEEELLARLEQLYLELGSVQDSLVENSKALRESLAKREAAGKRRRELVATAIHRTLLTEAAELRERERVWQERLDEAESRLRAFREIPDLAERIAEFRKLDERMDTLDLLPESYREVVKRHHTDLKDRLRPHLEEPKHDPLPPLRLAVAVGITASRTGPEPTSPRGARVVAVLPVDFATHARAREGKPDLCARFAFRVLASLSRFVVHIGARAEPQPLDVDGLLAVELTFEDLDLPLAAADMARALRECFSDHQDMQMSRVNLWTDLVLVAMGGIDALVARSREEPEGDEETATPSARARSALKRR